MKKQPGYGIMLGLTIAAAASAAITLLPSAGHPANVLGYGSLCVWAPWSTIILVGLAGTFCKLRNRLFKTSA
jgi:hypothetical protein